MNHRELSEQTIISGFHKGNANIIREYFYGYCQAGYYIFDQRYQLSEKENLDFMSLAHQYAIYLMEHDWKPLEDHSPNVSLKTWLINGFRYVVLDALKWCMQRGRARIWTLSEKKLWNRKERHQSLLHRWSRTRSLYSAAI